MLKLTSPPSAPFDINARNDEGRAAARFSQPDVAFKGQVVGVDTYLMAMRSSMGDVAKATENALGEVVKALGEPPQAYSYATASFMPDPANAGLLPWPGIAPESLRKIARENIAPQLVARARVADLARYSGLSHNIWEPGWQVGMRVASETPTEQDRADIRDAERFVWNCNRESGYSDARRRDAHLLHPFDMFLRAFGDDTHTFDGWAVWTDMTRDGKVKAFANLPAGNIRLAVPGRGVAGDPRLFAALVDETGNPVKSFTRDELFWSVRNPRNDPVSYGYGWSEIEVAVLMVQALQSAIQLNNDTFTKSSIPNGMMLLKGDFWNQSQIDAIMREWTNMKRGVSKMWGIPVMSVPEGADVEVMPLMDLKGQEIRYRDHINLMGGLYCVISQFPPRRLGIFASGAQRDNAPVQNESVEQAGVDDPGLPALLGFVSNRVNEYLMWPNWPRLRMWFNGANPKQDAREYEARKQARTWAESRAEVDLKKLTDGVPEKYRPLVEVMQYCPEDSSKVAAFSTLAAKWLETLTPKDEGTGGTARDEKRTGAPFPSKTDPAASLAHGHRAGVRRDGAQEEAHAETPGAVGP